jgi:hypothetical protein
MARVQSARVNVGRWIRSAVGWWMLTAAAWIAAGNPAAEGLGAPVKGSKLRFEVTLPAGVQLGQDARLLVVLAGPGRGEPRKWLGRLGSEAPTVLGIDVPSGDPTRKWKVGEGAAVFPWRVLGELPVATYRVQALLMTNRDLWLPEAPGNWHSKPLTVNLDARSGQTVALRLTEMLPVEALPADREFVRFRRIRSEVLSRFWGRDIWVRVGVVLPRSWSSDENRRYPLMLDIGGYGSRFHRAEDWLDPDHAERRAWMEPDAPQMIRVMLDGAGPLGDPYQVDSENHGPFGTALVEEVLPVLEHEFRGIGQPWARFTTGGSTGGWVSFALQCLYPDVFGGCWSGFPDPLDFRHFQLINLYADTNAFVNRHGFERPASRTLEGDVKFTMRHEVQYENVLGLGNVFTRSGGQWGAWNATFGVRGPDGWPVPAWDPRTGALDPGTPERWGKWDLRRMLEENWGVLGPKLKGKLRVWVGEADEYFLNHGVHRMDEFLLRTDPAAAARFEYGAGRGHGWNPRPMPMVWREMQEVLDGGAPVESGREAYFRSRFLHGAACVHCKGGR